MFVVQIRYETILPCPSSERRPEQRWLRTVKQDLRAVSMGLVSAKRCTQNCVLWKAIVETPDKRWMHVHIAARRMIFFRFRMCELLSLHLRKSTQNVLRNEAKPRWHRHITASSLPVHKDGGDGDDH